jgi:2-methylcitrate dehydratase PrpD
MAHDPKTTQKFAAFIVETPASAVPEPSLVAVERAFFDLVGVAMGGAVEPPCRIMQTLVLEKGSRPEAQVIGTSFRTTVADAAYLNGTAAHALDFDDVGGFGHPSSSLVPSLLALGESCGSSGAELVDAYAIGFEVGVVLCSGYNQYERCFHSTGVFGSLASAAAGARLMKLSVGQTMHALAIASSMASGIGRNAGSMTKPLHGGLAARNGVEAVIMARAGFTGAPDLFEAKQGFCEAFLGDNRYDLKAMAAKLGNPFKAATTLGIKSYPTCFGASNAIDAMLHMKQLHGFGVDDIEAIEVSGVTYLSPIARFPDPADGMQAKFSVEHALAVAAMAGEIRIQHFDDEFVNSAQMRALRAKVRVLISARWNPNIMYGTEDGTPVTVILKDGRKLSHHVLKDMSLGKPKNPVSEEKLAEKFRDNVQRVLPAGGNLNAIVTEFRNLRGMADIRTGMGLLAV